MCVENARFFVPAQLLTTSVRHGQHTQNKAHKQCVYFYYWVIQIDFLSNVIRLLETRSQIFLWIYSIGNNGNDDDGHEVVLQTAEAFRMTLISNSESFIIFTLSGGSIILFMWTTATLRSHSRGMGNISVLILSRRIKWWRKQWRKGRWDRGVRKWFVETAKLVTGVAMSTASLSSIDGRRVYLA